MTLEELKILGVQVSVKCFKILSLHLLNVIYRSSMEHFTYVITLNTQYNNSTYQSYDCHGVSDQEVRYFKRSRGQGIWNWSHSLPWTPCVQAQRDRRAPGWFLTSDVRWQWRSPAGLCRSTVLCWAVKRNHLCYRNSETKGTSFTALWCLKRKFYFWLTSIYHP